jgi:CheY-like chemotaxis protein
VVANGQEAIEKARALRPLAVTLDIMLPGVDGWEVLRALKSSPATRDIPVVVVSVMDNRSLGIALGADDYLVKPLDRQALLDALGRFTGRPAVGREGQLKVLVVDDDQETLDRLERQLQPEFAVLKARGGALGIEAARTEVPDLVLLDLVMGDVSGFEVVSALKADARTRDVPILVMTGRDLSEADKARLNGQVEQILSKGQEGTRQLVGRLELLKAGGRADGAASVTAMHAGS